MPPRTGISAPRRGSARIGCRSAFRLRRAAGVPSAAGRGVRFPASRAGQGIEQRIVEDAAIIRDAGEVGVVIVPREARRADHAACSCLLGRVVPSETISCSMKGGSRGRGEGDLLPPGDVPVDLLRRRASCPAPASLPEFRGSCCSFATAGIINKLTITIQGFY